MSQQLTVAMQNRILNWILLGTTPSRPTGPLQVALFIQMPDSEDGTGGVEPDKDYGYARRTVTFSQAVDGTVANNAQVTFNMASGGAWGIIEGIGIYDASETLILSGELMNSRTVDDADTFAIAEGQLVITIA